MPFILRVDVDRPYGITSFMRKVMGKLKENYWFPCIDSLGYLSYLAEFLRYCNDQQVSGLFYFRLCTIPNEEIKKLLRQGNHKIGFHAENTRSLESFKNELNSFCKALPDFEIDSYTKHGLGDHQRGKNHYAPYEPEKYRQWAMQIGIDYFLGNGNAKNADAFKLNASYIPDMFWAESEFRHPGFSSIEEATELAKQANVPVLLHPESYSFSEQTKNDFHTLVRLSKEKKVMWEVGIK